jgi:ribosomal protein S18 acetylase RimI-like enzyme
MMSENHLDLKKLQIRPAQKEDAHAASRLIYQSFPKMASFVMGLGDENRARLILEKLFERPGHRLSFEHALIVAYQGKVIALSIAFPGAQLKSLNRHLARYLFKRHRLRGRLALICRTWPLIFIKESDQAAYYLSNLAVKRRFQGCGVGKRLLERIEKQARDAGYSAVDLMVSINHRKAKGFYEAMGFETRALHLESNRRVKYVGAGYQKMVKPLGKTKADA